MIGGRRFHKRRDGTYQLRLGANERKLLAALPEQAHPLIETRGPATVRLFPPAYPGDPAAEAEYRDVVGGELLHRHQGALDVIAATAASGELDAEQLEQWMAGLEVLRLLLGTQLDVSEGADATSVEPLDESDRARIAVYRYLGMLQAEVVEVLEAAVGEHRPGSDHS